MPPLYRFGRLHEMADLRATPSISTTAKQEVDALGRPLPMKKSKPTQIGDHPNQDRQAEAKAGAPIEHF